MELENIIEKGKKRIAILGLAGVLGISSMAGLNANVGVPQDKKDLATLGKMIKGLGGSAGELGGALEYWALLGHREKIAREGSSQININQSGQRARGVNYDSNGRKYILEPEYTWVNPDDPEDLSVKKIIGSGFSFRWVDYNRSGSVDDLKEFIERKNRFKRDESIAIALIYEAEEPFHQNLKISGPLGRIIYEYDMDPNKEIDVRTTYNLEGERYAFAVESKYHKGGYTPKKEGMIVGLSREYIENTLLKKYGEGEYSVVWRVNERIQDSITFDIIY